MLRVAELRSDVWLDAHDAVVLGDHPGELGRGEPARVPAHSKVCVGRPTGDGAALSDVDGNAGCSMSFCSSYPQRRIAQDALEAAPPARAQRRAPSHRPPARPRIPAPPPPTRWRQCEAAASALVGSAAPAVARDRGVFMPRAYDVGRCRATCRETIADGGTLERDPRGVITLPLRAGRAGLAPGRS